MFNLTFMINFCLNYEKSKLFSCWSHLREYLLQRGLVEKRAFFWDDNISKELFSLQQMMTFNGHLNWILAWWMDSISGFLVNQIFIPSAPFFNFVKDGCMRQCSGKIPNGIFSRVLKLNCFFWKFWSCYTFHYSLVKSPPHLQKIFFEWCILYIFPIFYSGPIWYSNLFAPCGTR